MPATLDEKQIVDALEQIKSEFTKHATSLTELVTKQREEIEKHGGTVTETGKSIKTHEESLKKLADDYNGLKASFEQFQAKAGRNIGGDAENERKSIGQRFVESTEFKEYAANPSPHGSSRFELRTFYNGNRLELKAVTGFADLRGQFSVERLLEIMSGRLRAQRIRDLIPVIPTTNSSVEWVRETGFTNLAAPWAEGGAAKPESGLSFEIRATNCKIIAHWTPVPRQVIDDLPALRAYIDGRLKEGLWLKEDVQLLIGDGTGANIQGLLTDPDVQTYLESTDGKGGDTMLHTLRRAATKVRLAEYMATGAILNPVDWENIELAMDRNDQFLWVNVVTGGQARLWRMDIVDTTAMPEGQFLVGALDQACMIWDREQANVRIAEQHADFFTKNMVALLAEERLCLTTIRPEAIVSGTFDGPPEVPPEEP